jgi:arylsulfatase A-like enzyme/tetratricopeptide (TPR) repeat protein
MHRVALAFLLVGLGACSAGRQAAPAVSNILLVTIDTMRADRLGRGFTPTLDRLAERGLRFTQARTVVPLTLPAHVSLMTGQFPAAHGIHLNGGAKPAGVTLASRLKEAGYQTRAVVGAFVLDRRFGLDAGFDEYDDQIARDPQATDRLQADRRANEVVDRAVALLSKTTVDRPWFFWVHFYDPHAPYDPPPDARTRAGGDAYNGEIAYVDAELTRLLSAVDSRPDGKQTATIVLGDHGESLGEHGEPTHGMLLFEAALRIPLIVTGPGVRPAERPDPASVIDVLPTALALAAQPQAETLGHNLLSPGSPDRETYAETEYPTVAGWTPLKALIQDRWKLVTADQPFLFDLQSDAGEQENLARVRVPIVQAMSARLTALSERAKDGGIGIGDKPSTRGDKPSGLSMETAERLRSLGYVAPSAAAVSGAGGKNPAEMMEAWATFESALTAVNAGRTADALPALSKLSSAYPSSSIFQSTYARALASSGRRQEALTRFRAAVKQWPADATLYHELAVVARDLGMAEEARRAEEAALALNVTDPSAHNGKGLLLADAGRAAEAAKAFEEAIRLDPGNAVYHANLGNARRSLGDLTAATAAYRKALELSPQLADAANGLGVVMVQQKQLSEAIRWLEQAAKDPAFVEAQLNLGIALQESGDVERAKAQYRKVLTAKGTQPKEREAARTLLAQLERR